MVEFEGRMMQHQVQAGALLWLRMNAMQPSMKD